jgi:hypothetical protein
VNGQLRIAELFAFICLDADGTEGVPAISAPGGLVLPLMGADLARMASLRRIVECDPALRGKRLTLAKFSTRVDLEVIQR